jgi:hypothetical protein
MHPLMATVLLRSACLNALMYDSELHPAERELGQPQLMKKQRDEPHQ